jgi:hypothetical protein
MDELSRWIDTTLYPDILERGGLGPALAEAASRSSVDLGPLTIPEGIQGYWDVSVSAGRGSVGVCLGAKERVFLINIANESHVWAAGKTEDLSDVVRVADHWRAGATLHELHTRFPFMTYSRLAQGYEDGNPVRAQWDDLLEDPDLTRIRPLLRAAHANDRLGRLFPSVTHHTLARFLLDHTNRDAGQVRIALRADGRYEVDSRWVDTPHTVDTIGEAIDAAVAQLPSTHPYP